MTVSTVKGYWASDEN